VPARFEADQAQRRSDHVGLVDAGALVGVGCAELTPGVQRIGAEGGEVRAEFGEVQDGAGWQLPTGADELDELAGDATRHRVWDGREEPLEVFALVHLRDVLVDLEEVDELLRGRQLPVVHQVREPGHRRVVDSTVGAQRVEPVGQT